MKFSEWKKYLCSWVNQCKFHKEPLTSVEDADPDMFFANYLELTRVHSSPTVALSPTVNNSLSTFLSEMYPEFKFFLNDDGTIQCKDYVFVYSILLYNACVRKPCVQLNLNSGVEQHCFSQFLEKMENTNVLTRQALHMIILDILIVEEDVTKDGIISVIDDGKTVAEDATNDGLIMDVKIDVLEIMVSSTNSPEDSDDNSGKFNDGDGELSINDDGQLLINNGSSLSINNDILLSTDDDSKLWVSDDSKVSINDDSEASINDDVKLLINDDGLLLINDDCKSSISSRSSLSMATKSFTPESFNDNTEEWENFDERILVKGQDENLEIRFHLAKERLCKGIINANLLGESLKRVTTLFSCCSLNVSHLMPKIRASRPSIDGDTEPGGYVLLRLLILMQKHGMKMPKFNQMESIYIQILTVIDYNLDQSYTCNTQLEMRLKELQIKNELLNHDNLQKKDGEQTMKLTNRNKSLVKRLAEMTKMRQMLIKESKLNAQCSKVGLMRKVVYLGVNVHIRFIKILKKELGLKLTVNKKIDVNIDDILICELKTLITSKDLLIEELTAKHNQFLDRIKTVINLSNTEKSIEHIIICQLIDMVDNHEKEMRSQPNVAGQIVDKIEAERNRLLQKLKINLNLKFNQSEKSETTENNMIDELKDLIVKKLDNRFFRNIHSTINKQLEILKESLNEFSDKWTLAKLRSFKNEDTMTAIQPVLNTIILSQQKLEEVIILSGEEIANFCGESSAKKDQEIIKLNAKVKEQRKAANDLLKTLKGTYKKKIDIDASILDSEFCFQNLNSYLKSFCLSYKQVVRKRNYLDKRAKCLAKQLTSRSVSHGQLTPSCWNQLDDMLNDLQISYDKVVSKIVVARGELNKYTEASSDYSEWIDQLREEFTIQVNISAVQQLRELMVNSTAQEQDDDMLSQQLMIKQLQLQLSKQRRDRKFAIKRLKSKLITCRRSSGRSAAQLRQLKQKLKIANEKIQPNTQEPKVANPLKQTLGQLSRAKFELMRMEQQLSLRDAYIKKLIDSRQLLQKELVTKAGKIEKLRQQNEQMPCEFNQLDTEAKTYPDNMSDQNEKEIILEFLQQDNLEMQDEFKRSVEEIETSYILALEYDLEESQHLLAIARQEVEELQADLEHLRHSGSVEQLNSFDNDEQKQPKSVATVLPSATRRRSKIPLPKSSSSSKGEKQQQSNIDKSVSQATSTAAATPPPPAIMFNTPQQLTEFHILHESAYSQIVQKDQQLSISEMNYKLLQAECAETKFLAKTQHILHGDMLYYQKWQSVKCLKSHLKIKRLQKKVKKLNIKVYFANLIQYNWSIENGGSNLCKELESLQLVNESLVKDLQKKQKDIYKFSATYLELNNFNYTLEQQIAAKDKQHDELSNNLKGSQRLANSLMTKLDTLESHVATLQSERDLLHAQLAQQSQDASNYFKMEKVNNELLNTLNLRKSRLLSLNDDYHNLQADFNENQNNLKNLEVKYKELEISLASREMSAEWKCDCRKIKETNAELLNDLEAQNQRLEKLESEKKAMQKVLKEAKDEESNYVKLEDADGQLQRNSDIKDKRLEELRNEKKKLYEELKQSQEWKCDCRKVKETNAELLNDLEAQNQRLEKLESEKKAMQKVLKEAKDKESNYVKLEDANVELQRNSDIKDKQLEELRNEKKKLYEELKQSQEWKCDCRKVKETNAELLNDLEAQKQRLEKLESEKKAMQKVLKEAKDKESNYVKLEDADGQLQRNSDIKDKRLEELRNEKKKLYEELKQSQEWKCDCRKVKETNAELLNDLEAQNQRLEKLESEKKALQNVLKEPKDKESNYVKLEDANGELQRNSDIKDKRLEELRNEKKKLYEELKQSQEWKCDCRKVKETNAELLNDLEAQNQRLEKLESEKKALQNVLKEAKDKESNYVKLEDANGELQRNSDIKDKQLEELRNEKKQLYEELKQSQEWKRDFLHLNDATREREQKQLEELESERKDLLEKLKQTEEWMRDYLMLKDTSSNLQQQLNAQEKLIAQLGKDNTNLQEELKEAEDCNYDCIKLKDANTELLNALSLKEEEVHKLDNEKTTLYDELVEAAHWKSECVQSGEVNSELKTALDLKEKRFKKLETMNRDLQLELQQSEEKKCDYFKFKDANSELQNALDVQEKLLKKLGNENKCLQEELNKAEEWKCNYLNLKKTNNELLNTLDSQEERFAKLESEKRNLHEELKRAAESTGDYLKLKEVYKDLKIEFDAEGQLIEKLENEREYLKEELKQAADVNCKYVILKEDNIALQNMLSAQEQLLEKSKNNTESLHKQLKLAEYWECDCLKLKDANSELQMELVDQDKLLEQLENEKKELFEKLKQSEASQCDYLELKDANNDLKNVLDAKQILLKELENEKKCLREDLEDTEALKGDYLKLKETNNELKNTLEAQENRYERLQKKFEYSQNKQQHFRQKCQDYQLIEISKTELESARRSHEERLKIMQEEFEEQTNRSQSQNWEQQLRQREEKISELEKTLVEKKKQIQLLQSGRQEFQINYPLVAQENQTNNSSTANVEFSQIQLRNVIEEQHERIKTLQSENNELNTNLGMCEQNVLELEKHNAAINYRMRKLDDLLKKTETSELQNKQKDLENENTSLHLEIGRLNAILNNSDRRDTIQYLMQETEDNTDRDQQAEDEDRT